MAVFAQSQKSIVHVLKHEGTLRIPRFQRGFAWGSDNFAELWDDIISRIVDENQSHFLGVIILTQDAHNPEILDVIDGQQRITCFTILLRAMYDRLDGDARDKYLADDIYHECIRRPDGENKLQLSEEDRALFERFIQNPRPIRERGGRRKSERAIVDAYKYFSARIDEEIHTRKQSGAEFVADLFRKLGNKAIVLEVIVPPEADPYTIFETINSKRVDLTASDLLKNYLFATAQHLSDEGSDKLVAVQGDWSNMVATLTATSKEPELSQYIRHYWISKFDQVRDKALYRAIKSKFNDNPGELLGFSGDLALEAMLYAAIIDTTQEAPTSIKSSQVREVNELRIRQSYPLLLSALASGITQNNFDRLITGIVSVSMRRGIAQMNPNELEGVYGAAARELRNYKDGAVDKILEKIQEQNISDSQVEDSILQNPLTEYAKIILKEYENALRGAAAQEELDISTGITLEHIMPQKPSSLSPYSMDEIHHKAYVDTLGNLTLIGRSYNRTMSNKAYGLKKAELSESSLLSTQGIPSAYTEWNADAIKSRGKLLAKFVTKRWPSNITTP